MNVEPLLACILCGKRLLDGDVVVGARTIATSGDLPVDVHLRCLRPPPRAALPVPPTLTDEDLAE